MLFKLQKDRTVLSCPHKLRLDKYNSGNVLQSTQVQTWCTWDWQTATASTNNSCLTFQSICIHFGSSFLETRGIKSMCLGEVVLWMSQCIPALHPLRRLFHETTWRQPATDSKMTLIVRCKMTHTICHIIYSSLILSVFLFFSCAVKLTQETASHVRRL